MRESEAKSRVAKLIGVALLLVSQALAQPAAVSRVPLRSPSAPVRPRRQVLVSIPDRKLALLEDGRVLKVFPVAVGASRSPSPTGQFKIVSRLTQPTYYHQGTVIAPGPQNPLGSRWLGLDRKGYGIHGTNAPRSIGKAASHGCIRMAKADLEELFRMLNLGDAVEIRGEGDEQTAALFATPAVVAQNTVAVGQ